MLKFVTISFLMSWLFATKPGPQGVACKVFSQTPTGERVGDGRVLPFPSALSPGGSAMESAHVPIKNSFFLC